MPEKLLSSSEDGAISGPGSLPNQPETTVSAHIAHTRKALLRNVSFDMATRAGYLLSRLFIPPFVLARLGLSAYGLWSAVFLIIGYVGTTSLGFTVSYIKLVAECVGRGETHKANSILSTGLLMCSVVCGSIFVLVVLGAAQILWWLSVPVQLQARARYLIIMVVAVHLADVVLSVFRASLIACQRIVESQSIWVAEYLLEAGLIFYLVGTGHGLYGLADAYAISTVFSIVLGIAVARYRNPWLRISPRLCSRLSLRTLLNFGGVVQISALLSNVIETAERAVAAPLIGLNAVGLLDLSGKLPRTSGSIPVAFATSFIPAASYLNGGLDGSSQKAEVIRRLYLKGSRYVSFSVATLLGLMATAPGSILAVWLGHLYPATAYLMTVFAIQQQLRLMTGPGTSILQGLGRPWQEFAFNVPNMLLAAMLFPLSRFVLGRWSAAGLGTAIVTASVLASVMFIARANRIFNVTARQYLRSVMPAVIPYLVGGLIAILLSNIAAGLSRWSGAVAITAAATLYLLILALVAHRLVLANDEREWFREIVKDRLARILQAA